MEKTSSLFNLCRCTFHKLMAHKDICRNIYFWAILAFHNLISSLLQKYANLFLGKYLFLWFCLCFWQCTAEAGLGLPPWEGRPNLGNALHFGPPICPDHMWTTVQESFFVPIHWNHVIETVSIWLLVLDPSIFPVEKNALHIFTWLESTFEIGDHLLTS